jgi:hypothetical protein
MAILTPTPKFSAITATGTPLVGGKLYSYAAGTSTPIATYTDSYGTTANSNPVILDARGEANVWLLDTAAYKLALYDADNNLIWTVDNVNGDTGLSGPTGASLIGFIQAGTNAVATNVQQKLRQQVSVFDFMTAAQIADVQAGTCLIDVTQAVQNAIDAKIGPVYFPEGAYRLTSPIVLGVNAPSIYGTGAWYGATSTSTFSAASKSVLYLDHGSEGIIVKNTISSGITIKNFSIYRADVYKDSGANILLDAQAGSTVVISYITISDIYAVQGAYGIVCRALIYGSFSRLYIHKNTQYALYFQGTIGTAFPNSNVLTFTDCQFKTAGTAIYFEGDAGKNIKFISTDISSCTNTIVVDESADRYLFNVDFDMLWLEVNTNPMKLRGGRNITFRNLRNSNLSSIPLFEESTFAARNVVVDGFYGAGAATNLTTTDVDFRRIVLSDGTTAGDSAGSITDLSGSYTAGVNTTPYVSSAQSAANSHLNVFRQSGTLGKNYLLNWNIVGSGNWIKTSATLVSAETDPLGGTQATSWVGTVVGLTGTRPAIAVGQVYEIAVWARGKGYLIFNQTFSGSWKHYIDTNSWVRLVFRTKIRSTAQVSNNFVLNLTPDSGSKIIVWRPGWYDTLNSIDTRPSTVSGSFEGGYIPTSYTAGERVGNNIYVLGTAVPTEGYWMIGDRVINTTPSPTSPFGQSGWICVYTKTAALSAAVAAGGTSIRLSNPTGSLTGDLIGITLDSGAIHWTTLASSTGVNPMTLTAAVPSGASVNRPVYEYRFQSLGAIT